MWHKIPLHIILRGKGHSGSGFVSGHRTTQMSNMQNLALQVGQGTLLDNQVSGLCWSWRLANHRPRHVRHHMGLQKHCWHSESSAPETQISWTDRHHINEDTLTCAHIVVYPWHYVDFHWFPETLISNFTCSLQGLGCPDSRDVYFK